MGILLVNSRWMWQLQNDVLMLDPVVVQSVPNTTKIGLPNVDIEKHCGFHPSKLTFICQFLPESTEIAVDCTQSLAFEQVFVSFYSIRNYKHTATLNV